MKSHKKEIITVAILMAAAVVIFAGILKPEATQTKKCSLIYIPKIRDNTNDFYEILDKIDLCIMDYSSIFTDFIAAGCKHFLRYAFDFDNDDLDFPMDYDEVTPGRKCKNFDELVQALSEYEKDDPDYR